MIFPLPQSSSKKIKVFNFHNTQDFKMAKQSKKGSRQNPLTSEDLLNLNKRVFIINEAVVKDDICNYVYEVISGVGLGDKHNVTGTGIVDDSLQTAFGRFNVHLATIDEVFKHSGIDFEDIDTMHTHELTALFRVRSFKIKKSKGYESISLKGEKYVSSAGGWNSITSTEVALDKLSSYKWYDELKAVADQAREEVALYKEGKYTPVKAEEPKEDKNQKSLFDATADVETESELLNSKMD